MKVIVAQIGARMRYAPAVALAKHEMLSYLVTDFCLTDKPRWFRHWLDVAARRGISSLARRALGHDPEIPPSYIKSLDHLRAAFVGAALLRALSSRLGLYNRNQVSPNEIFCKSVASVIAKVPYDAIYCHDTVAREIFAAAKRQGKWTILEQCIAPRRGMREVLSAEEARWGRIGTIGAAADTGDVSIEREEAEWALADMIVAPSQFVEAELVRAGVPKAKIHVVPYGIPSGDVARRHARRAGLGPLNVLFVGQVGLRKGVPYLIEAARRLGRTTACFRCVGPIALPPRVLTEGRDVIEFVGVLPRADVEAHYEWADVLLLPSLWEGSATVVLEALRRGIPVIATEESGPPPELGPPLIYRIPARDPEAICEALSNFRRDMVHGRLPEILDIRPLTLDAYGYRLSSALKRGLKPDQGISSENGA
jgi:glycosyltransferase involved in cell wall biosynthesis